MPAAGFTETFVIVPGGGGVSMSVCPAAESTYGCRRLAATLSRTAASSSSLGRATLALSGADTTMRRLPAGNHSSASAFTSGSVTAGRNRR